MGAPQYEQAGADIGGSGTTNTIPRWTGPSTLGDSGLIDDGTQVYTTTRNIGIGTAGPSARLHVSDNSSIPAIIQSSGNTASYLRFINTTNNLGYIGYVGTNLYLAPNNGAGNVGIGTASPGSILDVLKAQNGTTNLQVRNTNAGSAAQSRLDLVTDVGAGLIGVVSSAWVSGGVSNGDMYIANNNARQVALFTGGQLRMAVAGTGATAADSQVAIGTSSFTSGCSLTVTKSIDCSQSAQGLKLPATPGNADTQTLDCYEENTWVPTLSGFGGTAPTVQTARYTRIGRMVVCNLVLVATGGNQFSASTGTPTYVTLPFTPATDGAAPVTNSGVAALGPGLIGTNARFYIPTFALTTATTSATIIFTV